MLKVQKLDIKKLEKSSSLKILICLTLYEELQIQITREIETKDGQSTELCIQLLI